MDEIGLTCNISLVISAWPSPFSVNTDKSELPCMRPSLFQVVNKGDNDELGLGLFLEVLADEVKELVQLALNLHGQARAKAR